MLTFYDEHSNILVVKFLGNICSKSKPESLKQQLVIPPLVSMCLACTVYEIRYLICVWVGPFTN